jgi:hypothetical protein
VSNGASVIPCLWNLQEPRTGKRNAPETDSGARFNDQK